MPAIRCRFCGGMRGTVVLDLGDQPACDHFPSVSDPGPDPSYPLRMWLCAACGLAQLAENPVGGEEPRGQEPAALVEQAKDAVRRVSVRRLMPPGTTVVEYGSPHGGSWLDLLTARGAEVASPGGPADLIVDCFGLTHEADQRAALQERADRLARGGTLLLQFHSLATILRLGQWNSLRHGHFAYHSTPVLVEMLAVVGLCARGAEWFDLYGGTVMLIAGHSGAPDSGLRGLIAYEDQVGVRDPDVVSDLQVDASIAACRLADQVYSRRAGGAQVYGYSAASRAVSLLTSSGLTATELTAIADVSPAKCGRRMPGTNIPVVSPQEMLDAAPDDVILFVPDLLPEVRRALPQIERAGGRWILAEPGAAP